MDLKRLSLLPSVVEGLGYQLLDLEWVPKEDKVLRVIIDHTRGIQLKDCTTVSKAVSKCLDVDDDFDESYRLEVSSPGINRELKTDSDLFRFQGSQVKILYCDSVSEIQELIGKLQTVNEDEINLLIVKKEHKIGRNHILKIFLFPEILTPLR